MPRTRPFVLCIAGHDPSAGAGLLADVKTIEANKVYALGVVTCTTFQTEDKFEGLDWLSKEQVIKQIKILIAQYQIQVVKIGIVKDLNELLEIVELLHSYNPKIKIVWDPVLKASAGYEFHNSIDQSLFEKLCSLMYIVTPNWNELNQIYPNQDPLEAGAHLQKKCNLYLKGGHHPTLIGLDYLFQKEKTVVQHYKAKSIGSYSKHGSGCVFSSALAAYLAKGYTLHKSCLKAKGYISNFLNSNVFLLGWHKI